MAHHRDLGVEDRVHRVEALAPALELHGTGTGADQCGRVAHGLLTGHVVAHPGEVADDECLRADARDRGDMVRHVVDGDPQRVVVAEHDHRERVPDEDHVDPRFVDDARARRVVRGDHDERLTPPLPGGDVGRAGRTLSGHLAHLHRPGHPRLPAAPAQYRNWLGGETSERYRRAARCLEAASARESA